MRSSFICSLDIVVCQFKNVLVVSTFEGTVKLPSSDEMNDSSDYLCQILDTTRPTPLNERSVAENSIMTRFHGKASKHK